MAGKVTNIAVAPAEWPKGTIRWPCMYGERTKFAMADHHSCTADKPLGGRSKSKE